jgi:hypothetical protein
MFLVQRIYKSTGSYQTSFENGENSNDYDTRFFRKSSKQDFFYYKKSKAEG